MKLKLLLVALILAYGAQGQVRSDKQKSISWRVERMDSTYNPSSPTASGEIISKYKPAIERLLEPIGKSAKQMSIGEPEGELSNWAVDALKKYTNNYIKENRIKGECDISLLNSGGMRTTMPKGDINAYDILSIFPFENRVVILFIEGKYVRMLMESFAIRNKIEPMGGVEIEIKDKRVKKCLINGEPIDDKKTYTIATIDFLQHGGDNVFALKYASESIDTGITLRNLFTEYIKGETAKGRIIDAHKDGRAKL